MAQKNEGHAFLRFLRFFSRFHRLDRGFNDFQFLFVQRVQHGINPLSALASFIFGRVKVLIYNDWNSKEIQISEPFIYEYTDGWSNVWAYAYTINYMLLLLLAISLSNVFSIEYYRKTDAIILCSQYGKKQLFISKILAGMTFSIASAIILFAATLFSSLLVYGTDGFHAALQLAFPLSSLNISVGGSVLVLLVNLIVISMVYGSLIMLLSAILKSNVAVMAIPVGIMILTMMVDIPYQFRLASQVYDLLPTNILNKTELWDDRLICIWGKYFTNFQIAPFLYVVFTF